MDVYRHNVSASFAQRSAAQLILPQPFKRGMSRKQLQVFDAGNCVPASLQTPLGRPAASNSVLIYGGVGALI